MRKATCLILTFLLGMTLATGVAMFLRPVQAAVDPRQPLYAQPAICAQLLSTPPAPITDLQRDFDQTATTGAADIRALPEDRLQMLASRQLMDSLVLLDRRLGSHEADRFLNEEVARAARIFEVMKAQEVPPQN
jgi:hypothetical protein